MDYSRREVLSALGIGLAGGLVGSVLGPMASEEFEKLTDDNGLTYRVHIYSDPKDTPEEVAIAMGGKSTSFMEVSSEYVYSDFDIYRDGGHDLLPKSAFSTKAFSRRVEAPEKFYLRVTSPFLNGTKFYQFEAEFMDNEELLEIIAQELYNPRTSEFLVTRTDNKREIDPSEASIPLLVRKIDDISTEYLITGVESLTEGSQEKAIDFFNRRKQAYEALELLKRQ